MTLSADEQDLFDEARAALPSWYTSNARANEELGMLAKQMGASLTQVRDWLQNQVFIKRAEGATSTTPDWLNQHAIDRGTSRQKDEPDGVLRDRLRLFADGITRQALMSAVQSILASYGISLTPPPYMVELPRDEAFFRGLTSDTGTGGTFSIVSGSMAFTPTVAFKIPPYLDATVLLADGSTDTMPTNNGRVRSYTITLSGSASSGNNGTFTTTGLSNNAAKYTNGSGAAGADAGVSWTIHRKDYQGITVDGRKDAFLSRGYRLGRRGSEIVVILPYGTTPAATKSVTEMLRTKKAAGVVMRVETRANP